MRQPELGRKILELRKEKGLTQEELVEKCNISVRTLQRIETGEVTPRIFTIRTILAALDYDLSTIAENEDTGTGTPVNTLREYLLLESDSTAFLTSQLTVAWISGVLYFMLSLYEGAAEIASLQADRLTVAEAYYVVLKVAVLVTFVLFQRGFVALGGLSANYLLRITSFVLIIGDVVVTGYDIASALYGPGPDAFILGAEAFTYGGIMIVYGVALRRLRPIVGGIAGYAGLFEIIAGCLFLTVVFSFIGFFVLMPAELLQIIILYKSVDIAKVTRVTDSSGGATQAVV
ncbi:MAG: helix-turn-helix domain-containing protein [Bacteroidetes bacterium]|nr:helix-turn-helix domain-containing protein [Bacteroidota bacterium]